MSLNTSMRLGSTRQACSTGLQAQMTLMAQIIFLLIWMHCCYLRFHLTALELLFVPTFFILGYSKSSQTSNSMSQLPLKISCIMMPDAFRLNHLEHKSSVESGVAALYMLPGCNCCTSQLSLKQKGSFFSYLWFPLVLVLLNRDGSPHSFRDTKWRTGFTRNQNVSTARYAYSLVQVIFSHL